MHLSDAQSPGKYKTWQLETAESIRFFNENKAQYTESPPLSLPGLFTVILYIEYST